MLNTVVSGWLKTEQVIAEDSGVWLAVSRNKSMLKKMVFGWLKTEQVNAEDSGVWLAENRTGQC